MNKANGFLQQLWVYSSHDERRGHTTPLSRGALCCPRLPARSARLGAQHASAYGFSVTITASMALLSSIRGAPTALQIVAFAGGAVAAFAVVEMVVSWGFTRGLEDEPTKVKELGSSISILSVGVAIGCAYVVGRLVGGLVVWPLGSFVATATYLFLFGVELGLANRIQRRRANRRSD